MVHYVRGHYRKGGTYVNGHTRSNPGTANNAAVIAAMIVGLIALIIGIVQVITFIVKKMVETFGVQDTVIAFLSGFTILVILIAASANAVLTTLPPIAIIAGTPYALKLVREYRNKSKDNSIQAEP